MLLISIAGDSINLVVDDDMCNKQDFLVNGSDAYFWGEGSTDCLPGITSGDDRAEMSREILNAAVRVVNMNITIFAIVAFSLSDKAILN